MRKPSLTVVMSVLLVLSWVGFLVGRPFAADEEKAKLQKWEYKETTINKLRELGDEGWEAYAAGVGVYYLKRPKN